eukprot:COSAG01_NODE_2930_length_6835_cov_82.625891_8_plen_77_part_00
MERGWFPPVPSACDTAGRRRGRGGDDGGGELGHEGQASRVLDFTRGEEAAGHVEGEAAVGRYDELRRGGAPSAHAC